MPEDNTNEIPVSATPAESQELDSSTQPPQEETDAVAQEPHTGPVEPSSPSPKNGENNEGKEPSTAPDEGAHKVEIDAQEVKVKYERQAESPAASSKNTGSQNDYRDEPRIHVRWHADVLVEGQGVYHGFVKEISLNGSDFFLDFEMAAKSIRMRIHVPPTSKTAPPRFMEISGKVVYTSYDSQESLFHTGIKFLEFKSESDRSFLEARIAAFNRPK